MNVVKKFVREYGIWIVTGCIMQKLAFVAAARHRGTSYAIGSEIFVLPLFILFAVFLAEMRDRTLETDEEADDEEYEGEVYEDDYRE